MLEANRSEAKKTFQVGSQEDMLAKERNQLKKATGYINLAKKNPKSESAWKYYYNAALAFIKAGSP